MNTVSFNVFCEVTCTCGLRHQITVSKPGLSTLFVCSIPFSLLRGCKRQWMLKTLSNGHLIIGEYDYSRSQQQNPRP